MVGLVGGRSGRLSAVAGGGAAERQLSDPSGHGAAAGRRSADHGILGGDAARAAVRADPGPHPDDLGERARLHPDHPAVRSEPRTSTARSATRCRRSTRRTRSCRPDLPYPPTIRKVNPADTPILVLGITSDTLPLTTVDAYAENILLQKISQISGVGLVGIGGQQKPAIRVQVDPQALAARGINLEDVRDGAWRRPMSTCRRARSTARARPIRSTPTISCSSPTHTPTWSSPIATERRSASAMSAAPSARQRTI